MSIRHCLWFQLFPLCILGTRIQACLATCLAESFLSEHKRHGRSCEMASAVVERTPDQGMSSRGVKLFPTHGAYLPALNINPEGVPFGLLSGLQLGIINMNAGFTGQA